MGDMRGSAGCEAVVIRLDRRKITPSNLHYLSGMIALQKNVFFFFTDVCLSELDTKASSEAQEKVKK